MDRSIRFILEKLVLLNDFYIFVWLAKYVCCDDFNTLQK